MTAEGILTSERVNALLYACLPEGERDLAHLKLVKGLTRTYGFLPDRLEEHRSEIEALIKEVPSEFMAGEGGGDGYTFLALCNDRHGNQWTGLHLDMEALTCLALGIQKAEFCAPREVWSALPGGMPYIRFKQ